VCFFNNLAINISKNILKTKDMMVSFREPKDYPIPSYIGDTVKRVPSFYIRVNIYFVKKKNENIKHWKTFSRPTVFRVTNIFRDSSR